MGWFYKDGDTELGPLDRAAMQEAVRAGTINDDTLIRDERSSLWKTLRQMRDEARLRKNRGQQPEQQPGAGPQAVPSSTGDVVCSECGRFFREDEVINYKGYNICASCKPVFIQKLKEGATLPHAMVYGGFWIRFAAKFIDWIVLGMVNMLFSTVFGALVGLTAPGAVTQGSAGGPPEFSPVYIFMIIVTMLFQIGLPIFYATFLVGKYDATLGKMACGLKIVTAEGEKVTYLRAFARYFAEILSGLILLIGYIMAAFDEEKRTLHDRICSTRVIKK